MSGREIITLQLGHYSNFVSTHFWNLNELSFQYNSNFHSEINHDVLYRTGLTNKGAVTYTPRTLSVDLKGSLKHLSSQGTLYTEENENDTENTNLNWDENRVEIKKEEIQPKPKFVNDIEGENIQHILNSKQNLEDSVHVWSDFLYTRFHPRTVNVINQYVHDDNNKEFDVFPLGNILWNDVHFSEDFSDKIRKYAEECDNFQGFHVILDAFDGFSGLATSAIEYIKDEYEKKSILAIPIIPSHYKDYNESETQKSIDKDSIRVINIAYCFKRLAENASLFVPLCTGISGWRKPGEEIPFYHLNYNSKLWYHSSAILASAIDTFTLKHRMNVSNFSLNDLCADLSGSGRKAAASTLCLPFSFNKDATLLDCLNNWEGPLSKSITPNCKIGCKDLKQYWFLRGIPGEKLKLPSDKGGDQKKIPAYNCKTVEEMLNYYIECTTFHSANVITACEKGLVTKTPYPDIFENCVGIDGFIGAEARPNNSIVQSVPVLAGLHSGSEIGNMFETLHTELTRIKFSRFHRFIGNGYEVDDYKECLEKLFDLRECY